jgi:hypothetical protein
MIIKIEGIEKEFRATLKRVHQLALGTYKEVQLVSMYLVPHFLIRWY